MKFHLFLAVAIVASVANRGLALPGYPHYCKKDVIKKITKIWNGNPPTGIIDHLKTVGEERVVLASDHYTTLFYTRHPTSILKCFYIKWNQSLDKGTGGLVFAVVLYSKRKGKKIVEGGGIKVIEDKGVTKCPKSICPSEREARRFYSKDGVIGIYMCSPYGRDFMASPDGFIKVRKDLINADGTYTDASVNIRIKEAQKKAKEIGITIDKDIPHAECEEYED